MGRWPFGSGAPRATWFSPVCLVEEAEQDTGETVFVYAPRADVVLHDNWQVSGFCATGSVDFEFRDVFVAEPFVYPWRPEPGQPGTLYRLPSTGGLDLSVDGSDCSTRTCARRDGRVRNARWEEEGAGRFHSAGGTRVGPSAGWAGPLELEALTRGHGQPGSVGALNLAG